MKRNIIIVQFFLLLLTGCYKGDVKYVDFADLSMAENSTFRVISQKTTNLQDLSNNPEWLELVGIIDTTTTPQANAAGITPPQRATSTSVAGIMQELLDFSKTAVSVELSGVYKSVDVNDQPILLSGKVILPAKGPIKRYILVSHYTIASNREAPSNIFSLEGLLVKLGYALIIPDYIGYGVTADKVHPYLVMELTARNVLDMYYAVVPFM